MEVQWINEEFKKVDSSVTTFTVPQRKKVLRELQLQKLQKIAQLPGMESYEAIDRDRLPKEYHTFQPFINQSASLESSKSKDIMVTWSAPIKIKLVLLPDTLL